MGTSWIIEDEYTFGLGTEPGFRIELLERFAVTFGVRKHANKHHRRRGILPGCGNAKYSILRAGATGNHGHARSICELSMSLSYVGCSALTAAHDGFNIGFVQAIKHWKEAFTRD